MKQYLADRFPLILSAVLPLVGVILAIQQYLENNRPMAVQLAIATVIGCAAWALILTS